jgi:hypothetical protein
LCGQFVSRGRFAVHLQKACPEAENRSIPEESQIKVFYEKHIIELINKLYTFFNLTDHDTRHISLISKFEKVFEKNTDPFTAHKFMQPPDNYIEQIAAINQWSVETVKWMLCPETFFKMLHLYNDLSKNSLVDSGKQLIDQLHIDIALENINKCIDNTKENLHNNQQITNLSDIGIVIPEDYRPFNDCPFPDVGDATPTLDE